MTNWTFAAHLALNEPEQFDRPLLDILFWDHCLGMDCSVVSGMIRRIMGDALKVSEAVCSSNHQHWYHPSKVRAQKRKAWSGYG